MLNYSRALVVRWVRPHGWSSSHGKQKKSNFVQIGTFRHAKSGWYGCRGKLSSRGVVVDHSLKELSGFEQSWYTPHGEKKVGKTNFSCKLSQFCQDNIPPLPKFVQDKIAAAFGNLTS